MTGVQTCALPISVTQEYADAVGADGYAADASTAVRKAKELINAKRELAKA